jgi:hypothetical protein
MLYLEHRLVQLNIDDILTRLHTALTRSDWMSL